MSEKGAPSLPADAPAEMPAPRLPRPPFWMIAIALVGIVASWLPMVIAAVARNNKSSETRIAIMQDMAVQPKLREQQSSVLFDDGRAMRPAIPGTVARGHLDLDDHYYRGFKIVHNDATGKDDAVFFTGFPSQVTIDAKLLNRGQERFNIYCATCHGPDGQGHGPVNEAANQLAERGATGMNWTQVANLRSPAIVAESEGDLFNTISNGKRAMPGYGAQVPVEDRWAIVAYVRALQLSQNAPRSALSDTQVKAVDEASK